MFFSGFIPFSDSVFQSFQRISDPISDTDSKGHTIVRRTALASGSQVRFVSGVNVAWQAPREPDFYSLYRQRI
jgi:hypothetical protein